MKRQLGIIGIIVAALLVISLASCSIPFSSGSGGGGAADKIKIGVICPLTGESSLYGDVLNQTIILLAEQKNEEGGILGKQVEVFSYDNRDDVVETTNAARKAALNDKVVTFIGTDSSASTIAMVEVASENEIPVIATIATNSKVTMTDDGELRPWAFRSCLSDPQNGAILGQYAVNELGYKKISIIYDIGSDYSVGITQEFTKNVELSGGEIVSAEAYNTGDVDYRAVLTKIKNSGDFDSLYVAAGYYKQIGLISNQARELGITQPLLSTEGALPSDIFNIAGDAVDGMIFNVPVNHESDRVQPLLDAFIERWDYDPSVNVGPDCYLAYDAFSMLTKAIENAGAADPKKIRDELEKFEEMDGLTGKMTFDPKTHLVYREVPIIQFQDGKAVTLELFLMEKP